MCLISAFPSTVNQNNNYPVIAVIVEGFNASLKTKEQQQKTQLTKKHQEHIEHFYKILNNLDLTDIYRSLRLTFERIQECIFSNISWYRAFAKVENIPNHKQVLIIFSK